MVDVTWLNNSPAITPATPASAESGRRDRDRPVHVDAHHLGGLPVGATARICLPSFVRRTSCAAEL